MLLSQRRSTGSIQYLLLERSHNTDTAEFEGFFGSCSQVSQYRQSYTLWFRYKRALDSKLGVQYIRHLHSNESVNFFKLVEFQTTQDKSVA